MKGDSHKRAMAKYSQKLRTYIVRCNKHTEADIVEKLDATENKSAYIKKLVREDIEDD